MKIANLFTVLIGIMLFTGSIQWYNEKEVKEDTADVNATVDQEVSLTCLFPSAKNIVSHMWKDSDGFSLASVANNSTTINRRDKYALSYTGNSSTLTIKKVEVKNQNCYTCEAKDDEDQSHTCKKCLYVTTQVLYVWEEINNKTKVTCLIGSKKSKVPSFRVTGIVTTGSPYSSGLPKGFNRNSDGYYYNTIVISNSTDAVKTPYCRYWINDTHAREYKIKLGKDPQNVENELTDFKVVYGRW
ncbi:MPPV-034 Ig-like domain putative IFN-gamma binding protein [Magpiepox virus 2]|nr:Ig-like domain putative IFN-gamma binding protein [Magpiepox virus]QZW33308.1 MPPV-034 Ig-like domain putative IFN-gamma binding protein [Magpiepox virus 2]